MYEFTYWSTVFTDQETARVYLYIRDRTPRFRNFIIDTWIKYRVKAVICVIAELVPDSNETFSNALVTALWPF